MRLEYFQMLDRIEAIDLEAATISVVSEVPVASTVFEGHFPGRPLVPGVLLLETMAQASGYLLIALEGFRRMVYFANAKEANFRAFVTPGSMLRVRAEIVHRGSGYAVAKAQIDADGKRASDAQLTFRVLPFDNGALEQHVRNEGARLGMVGSGQGGG